MEEAQSESREKVSSDDDVDDDEQQQQHVFEENEIHHVEKQDNQKRKQTVLDHLQREIDTATWCFETMVHNSQIDLIELCAPWDSPLCSAVRELGGTALALGPHNGCDLTTMDGYRKVLRIVRKLRPRYLHMSPPCYLWSPMQNCSVKQGDRLEQFLRDRKLSKKLISRSCRILEIQVFELDGDGGGEHPLAAQSWKQTELGRMARKCGGRFTVYGCCHGMIHPFTRKLLRKPWGWFSTSKHVRDSLESKCCHDADSHTPIEGAVTASTAIYPRILCRRFAKAILQPWNTEALFTKDLDLNGIFPGNENQTETEDTWTHSDEDTLIRKHNTEREHLCHRKEEGCPFDVELLNDERKTRAFLPDGSIFEWEDNWRYPGDNPFQGQKWKGETVFTWRVRPPPKGSLGGPEDLRGKIELIHRNLGHPNKETMLPLFRDAGATPEIIERVRNFECEHCLQRGRRGLEKPATVPAVRNKWECVSVDSFWWHTPKQLLATGEKGEHVVGVSLFDEATDYHTVVLIRTGENPHTNITGFEFQDAFRDHWIKVFPTPQRLRYDDEGFMRKLENIQWLESLGIKLEPIGGESAWQMGKHSRHLQVLKENANLLAHELGGKLSAKELFSLAVSAKNETHQTRGYSPNQWAFGANHKRISSFIENGENLVWNSNRETEDFETALKRELVARKLFLEADARRRIQRALRSQGRRLRCFETGMLVYFYRRGRKEGSRYGGRWYGPARVLCHEKTSENGDLEGPGSIVWISHAGVMIRCSPEQLRHVTNDVRQVDLELNGPCDFQTILKDMKQNKSYADITDQVGDMHDENMEPFNEDNPRFRLQGKRKRDPLDTPKEETRLTDRDLEHGGSQQDLRRVAGKPQQEGRPEQEGSSGSSSGNAFDRVGRDQGQLRQETPGRNLSQDSRGLRIPAVGEDTRETRLEHRRNEDVHRLPGQEDQSRGGEDGRDSVARGVKRPGEPLDSREHQEEDQCPREPSWRLHHARSRAGLGDRRVVRSGQHGIDQGECGDSTAARDNPSSGRTHGPYGEHSRADRTEDDLRAYEPARSRSRTPAGSRFDMKRDAALTASKYDKLPTISEGPEEKDCAAGVCRYVNKCDVVEIHLVIGARDVHKNNGVWVVNQKAKKGAEVNLRKLEAHEVEQFEEAKHKELESITENEAMKICEMHGIPKERVLGMRWVLTWKPLEDQEGQNVGKKAKARLIIKGYQDPDLLSVPREAPTLSSLGRNSILAEASKRRFKVCLGDIKTAFLNGDQTELDRNIFAEPPEDVREKLGMKPHEILRVAKAMYGLLHAPKRWFEKLKEVLVSQGWVPHQMDQCVFKLVDENGYVCGYIGVHVDDVICAGVGTCFDTHVKNFRESFPFGSWKCAYDETVKFCGCDIRQKENFNITVTQERFALSIDEINLDSARKAQVDAELDFKEKQNMRQTLGALNWRAVQTAPWMLATVSHLQGCTEGGTISDVLSVNKLVRWQRRYATSGLLFSHSIENDVVVTFTDASWATRKDGSSQGGQITLLMNKHVLDGDVSHFSVLCWGSKRLRRVARSSTSAEVQMSGNALDQHEFVKLFMHVLRSAEHVDLRNPDKILSSVESCLISDSKNVYDGLEKIETSGLQMEERRTAIELLGIKERLQQANVRCRWVSGDQELADGLTKPWQGDQLIKALEKARWQIVFDPEFMSAKRKKQLNQIQKRHGESNWLDAVMMLDERCHGQKYFWGCDDSKPCFQL